MSKNPAGDGDPRTNIACPQHGMTSPTAEAVSEAPLGRYIPGPHLGGMTQNTPTTHPELNLGTRTSVALVHDPQQGVRFEATVPLSSLATLRAAVVWLWAKVLPLVAAYLLGRVT